MSATLRKVALCILVGIIVLMIVQAVLGFLARLVVIVLLGALVLFLLGAWRGGDD
jgi:hypothetical protein